MRKSRVVLLVFWMVASILAGTGQDVMAQRQGPCDPWASKIVSLQGQVFIMRQGEDQWRPALLNDICCIGDRLRVTDNSRAAIVLNNDALLRIDQRTTIVFNDIEAERTFLINLIRGAVNFFSREVRSLKLITPFVNGVVKGTEFLARVEKDQTFISLFEGSIQAQNDFGQLLMAKGQSTIARANQAPRLEIVARPRDAVQWSLYYPPIIGFEAGAFDHAGPGTWQSKTGDSMRHYGRGDLGQAFAALKDITETINDPRYYVYRAGLALTVGRAIDARKDIDQALAIDPDHSPALALRSVIQVVQRRKEAALADAQQAVALDPASGPARIALSYVHQARFELDAARDQVMSATRQTPEDPIAWARLAELLLSTGDLDGAVSAAQKAVRLDDRVARSHVVLGYAYLTQVKIEPAEQAFVQAIKKDSADPLPRLGLGLAQIRRGEVGQGRSNIEIAAGLDPDNALIRSYLGKAYFEEKRTPLDQRQLEMAKQLDPQDPTPHFYDAIRKQSMNQPVKALRDLETAIALNDNRAVYRSRFLLDQDLAARSASLSRIYRDLDFQELALREGFKSLQSDPANYSAHRLLADAYAARPRHDRARASELLQSQLLQPLNINPLQPQLAETNLFILADAGPAEPAWNEFNPLFLRNRVALQASAVAGHKMTRGDEIVVSAVHDNVSLSAGQFYFETEGFRENNDLEHQIYNAFAQVGLSHRTSVQAEVRYRETERGDPFLRFDPDKFSPDVRRPQSIRSARLGFHHRTAPSSDLIGSWIYSDIESQFTIAPDLEVEVLDSGYIAEIAHLYRVQHFRLSSGIGYLSADRESTFKFLPLFDNNFQSDIEHLLGYLYVNALLPGGIDLTLGLSANRFEGFTDQAQLNPKIGVSRKFLKGATLRAAAFRVLEDTLIAKQRLEPTQVAGFNQFYEEVLDGGEAIDVWNYGVGYDQKITRTLSGGIEYVSRDMNVPFVDLFFTGEVDQVEWEENTLRVYFYATPLDWLSLSAVYRFETLRRDSDFTGEEEFAELDTHRLSAGVRVFAGQGFFGGIKVTHVDQEGEFGSGNDLVSDEDTFWVCDADLGYRLPRRIGVVSIEGKNIFNTAFEFQDSDPARPSIYPDQFILVKLTLSF